MDWFFFYYYFYFSFSLFLSVSVSAFVFVRKETRDNNNNILGFLIDIRQIAEKWIYWCGGGRPSPPLLREPKFLHPESVKWEKKQQQQPNRRPFSSYFLFRSRSAHPERRMTKEKNKRARRRDSFFFFPDLLFVCQLTSHGYSSSTALSQPGRVELSNGGPKPKDEDVKFLRALRMRPTPFIEKLPPANPTRERPSTRGSLAVLSGIIPPLISRALYNTARLHKFIESGSSKTTKKQNPPK